MAGEVQSGVTGENHRLLSRIYLHTSLSIYCNINRSRTTQANKKLRKKCKNAGEVPRGAIKSYREFLFYTIFWYNQEKCPVETFITLADIEPGPSPQSITPFLVEAHPNLQSFKYIRSLLLE